MNTAKFLALNADRSMQLAMKQEEGEAPAENPKVVCINHYLFLRKSSDTDYHFVQADPISEELTSIAVPKAAIAPEILALFPSA